MPEHDGPMKWIILGIDPGLSGALAFLDSDGGLEVFDMPVHRLVRGRKAKREIDRYELARIIDAAGHIERAIIEKVGAMPGQGSTSMFAFGRAVGVVEGVIAANFIPVDYVTPQKWRRAMGVRGGKDGIPALHRPSVAQGRNRHEDTMTKPMPYDEEIALEVCERIAQGEGLEGICEDPRLPCETTVRKWMAKESSFAVAYARAREQQMEKWADDVIRIADDASGDYVDRIGKDGAVERVVDPETVQRSKLRIDTRMRLMSKFAAKRFGDKLDLTLTGAVEVSSLSDAELEARTRARLVALGVEVAGPLLLTLPGQRAAKPVPEPEPVEIEAEPARRDGARGGGRAQPQSGGSLRPGQGRD